MLALSVNWNKRFLVMGTTFILHAYEKWGNEERDTVLYLEMSFQEIQINCKREHEDCCPLEVNERKK